MIAILATKGLSGLWTYVQDKIGDLKSMVIDQIKQMVITQVIQAGVEWLISLVGGPAGMAGKAIQGIVRVVTWLLENGERMLALANAVIDSVGNIAAGNIGGAAGYIERTLAQALPMVISFLADLLGLGGIAHKIQDIIKKIREVVHKPIDAIIKQAVALGKKLLGKLLGRSRNEKPNDNDPEHDAKVAKGLAQIDVEESRYRVFDYG